MTAFSEYLSQAKRPGWERHYIEYTSLKRLLEKFVERRCGITESSCVQDTKKLNNSSRVEITEWSNDEFHLMDEGFRYIEPDPICSDPICSSDEFIRNSPKNLMDVIATYERDEFCSFLDIEVQNCSHFYHQQLSIHKEQLTMLEKSLPELSIILTSQSLSSILETYKYLGEELLELYAYIGVNITALRQILIRYDGMMRTLDAPPLGQWYIVTRMQEKSDCPFSSLLIHYDILDVAEKYLKLVRKIQETIVSQEGKKCLEGYIKNVSKDMTMMESVLIKAEKTVDKASRGRMAMTDSVLYTIRYYFLTGSLMNDLTIQPAYIRTRGEKLKVEIEFFVNWRERTKPSFETVGGFRNSDVEKYTIQNIVRGPMVINLMSQLFFMMTHYIIEPSSAKYVESLGGNDALAGLLIGMTPWAALIAGFMYSFWSNYSFKKPLVCCGILLIFGSLIYALADRYNSIVIALIGRFMTGLGSPCTVNRRFIADTVPCVHRTYLSALFVTASAFGMSMGPGTAVLLDFFDFELNLPVIGEVRFNGMTGPGYLMFYLWILYLIVLLLHFEDGERIGLIELAAKQGSHYQPPDSPLRGNCSSKKNDYTCKSSPCSTLTHNELDDSSDVPVDEQHSPRLINQATVICMIFIFVGKVTLEALNSSDSIITRHRYNWSVKNVGTLGFVNGMLVIPIATTVGFLSQHYPDRTLLIILLCIAFFGVFLLLDNSDFAGGFESENGYNDHLFYSVGPHRFIAGQVLSFSSIHAFESVVQSTLSKVVPLALAQGTFNSGFIVTTLATVCDLYIEYLFTCFLFVSSSLTLYIFYFKICNVFSSGVDVGMFSSLSWG